VSWWKNLKERWLRGRPAGAPSASRLDAEVESPLQSPDAASQRATLPEQQVDEVAGRTPPTSSASPNDVER
jgi:hypothetical protein